MNLKHSLLPAIAGISACLLLSACSDDAPASRAAARAPVMVIAEPLRMESARTRVEAVGTSRALQSIELHPATSGEVVAVNFEPGQRVAAGDILVELDSRQERLAVKLAKLKLDDAKKLYERYSRSGKSGAVLPTEIDAAESQVEAARLELDRAQNALNDRFIDAPFDGYVDVTDVYGGDRIDPNTIITTVDNRSKLLVNFEVPEVLVGELKQGDQVEMTAWNKDASKLTGEVVEIGSRIDPATRTFVARATVDNEDDRLRPGMSFRVTVNLEGQAYPVITETALQWGADGAFVWLIVDGSAKRVPVKIIQRQQGRVLVDADLSKGDIIVVEGIQRMRDGAPVEYSSPGVALAPAKPIAATAAVVLN